MTLFKAGDNAHACAKRMVGTNLNDGLQALHRLGFVDNPWGEKACLLVKMTLHLGDKHWSLIMAYSYTYINGNSDDEGSADEFGGEVQPHAFLKLEWCILSSS
jgi:hypothetical protein